MTDALLKLCDEVLRNRHPDNDMRYSCSEIAPIAQALRAILTADVPKEIAEIEERHIHHAEMRKLLAAKNEPAGWAYKAQAMNAECFNDRATLLTHLRAALARQKELEVIVAERKDGT